MWKTILTDALAGFVAGSRFQHPTIGGEPMTEAERGANAASYTAGFLSRLEMIYGKEKAIEVFNQIGKTKPDTPKPVEPEPTVTWSGSVTVHKPDGTTTVVPAEDVAKLQQDVDDGYDWLNYPQGKSPVTYSFKYGVSTSPVWKEPQAATPEPTPKPMIDTFVMAVGRRFR